MAVASGRPGGGQGCGGGLREARSPWSNASTAIVQTVVEMTEEEDRLVSVNLKGTFLLAKYGIPALLEAGDGTIVVTGSISSFVRCLGWSAYCATKGGVLMFCRALALEYADRGIRCNCICPGSTDTPLVRLDVGSRGIPYDEAVRQDKTSHPLKRWAEPEEIAKAALFLSCDDSSFMTEPRSSWTAASPPSSRWWR